MIHQNSKVMDGPKYNIKHKTSWTKQPGTVNIIIKDPIETTNKNIDTLLSEVESIYLDYDLA